MRLCANRFKGRGIEYDDLYGAGCVGLVKASAAFDPERGVKFSTYAVPVILGEIKRLFRDGGAVKVSRSVKELGLRLNRESEKFSVEQGREPTVSELAEIIGVPVEDVSEALAANVRVMSLTAGYEEGEECQIDVAQPAPDRDITDILSLRQALGALSEEDRRLLYLRYFRDMTQTRVAEVMGMSQVQVSRREKKLLNMLRRDLL